MKQCTKCGEIKPLDMFYARKRSSDGKTPMCKACYTDARRDYYKRNSAKVLAINSKSYQKNKYDWREAMSRWKDENRDKVLNYKRKHNTKRRSTLLGRVRDSITSGIRRVIRGRKADKTFNLLPYTPEEVISHLMKTLPKGYTVDDFMTGKLHIDHIVPVSAFNITDENCIDFQRCWELKNLRFLPAQENLQKWNKLDKPFQPSLAIGA